MHWSCYPWYHLPTLVGGIGALVIARIAWTRRPVPGARATVWLMLAVALWSLACVGEFAAPTIAAKLFWVKLEYPGIAFISVIWFVMVLEYVGHAALVTRRNLLLLSVIPIGVILLNWTNEAHRLIYATAHIEWVGTMPFLAVTHGACFWIFIGYSYLLTLSGLVMSLHAILSSTLAYRKQIFILFLGAFIPVSANVLYLIHAGPIPFLDMTPLALTVTGGLLVLGMVRYNLWELSPIALRTIFNSIADGVLVLDAHGRVAECNLASSRMLAKSVGEIIGRPLHTIAPDWLVLPTPLPSRTGDFVCTITKEAPEWTVYEVRMAPLQAHGTHATGHVVIIHDDTERHQLEARLQSLAFFDTLTGLPNRSLFMDRLERTLITARRQETQTVVLFLDLDRFKEVNDTFGHSIGDELLRQAADRLTLCVRESDTVARLGGDEFVIILPHLQQTDSLDIPLQRIAAAFSAPFTLGEHTCTVSASIGMTIAPQDGDTVELLMQHADLAMYRAKRQGGNTCANYTAPL